MKSIGVHKHRTQKCRAKGGCPSAKGDGLLNPVTAKAVTVEIIAIG